VGTYGAGGYHLAARTPGQFVALGVPQSPTLADVAVSLTFRKVSGPPGGGVGIILRDQEPAQRNGLAQNGHYYVLEVSDRGEVGIWRRDATEWVDLVPWTPSTAARPAEAGNVIEARAIGSRLSLLVNGVEAATATDTTLATGTVGVFLGGDGNEAVLEDLAIRTP
jgi:hypothetical protein